MSYLLPVDVSFCLCPPSYYLSVTRTKLGPRSSWRWCVLKAIFLLLALGPPCMTPRLRVVEEWLGLLQGSYLGLQKYSLFLIWNSKHWIFSPSTTCYKIGLRNGCGAGSRPRGWLPHCLVGQWGAWLRWGAMGASWVSCCCCIKMKLKDGLTSSSPVSVCHKMFQPSVARKATPVYHLVFHWA